MAAIIAALVAVGGVVGFGAKWFWTSPTEALVAHTEIKECLRAEAKTQHNVLDTRIRQLELYQRDQAASSRATSEDVREIKDDIKRILKALP